MDADVSRAAFALALRHSDEATVRAYFAQPAVTRAARALESFVAAHGREPLHGETKSVRRAIFQRLVVHDAWFVLGSWLGKTVFNVKRSIHADTVAWFFARDAEPLAIAAQLPFTLGLVLYELLEVAVVKQDVGTLECLLTSPTYWDFFSDTEQESALALATRLLGPFGTAATAEILLAHGAQIDTALLGTLKPQRTVTTLQHLSAHSALVVGSPSVLIETMRQELPTTAVHTRTLLALGADPRGTDGRVLKQAAQREAFEIVRILLDEGVVDVDARDCQGRTVLHGLVLASQEFPLKRTLKLVSLLLAFGADPLAADDTGESAVSVATARQLPALLKALSVPGQ